MILSNKIYDILKWIQRLLLPALATFYLTLGSVWTGIVDLPYPEQVAATIAAVGVFLGALVKRSSDKYAEAVKTEELDAGNEVE